MLRSDKVKIAQGCLGLFLFAASAAISIGVLYRIFKWVAGVGDA